MKVVYNICYGGFGLNAAGLARYNELSGNSEHHSFGIRRDDPHLVQVVEEMGKECWDKCAKLAVEEIPEIYRDVFEINEYDGMEGVECNVDKLVASKIKKAELDTFTPEDALKFLQELQQLIKSELC